MTTRRRGLFALLLLALPAGPATAQTTYTWSGAAADAKWSQPGNWSPAGPPNAAGVVVRFTNGTLPRAKVDQTFTIGRLTIDLPAGVEAGFNLEQATFAATEKLVLDNAGSAAVIELLQGHPSFFHDITVPLEIAGNKSLIVNVAADQTLFLFRPISGADSTVTVNAGGQGGRVWFLDTNTYGGANSVTTVLGGVLQADEGGSLPTNTALVLNGGVFETASVNTTTVVARNLGTAPGQIRLTGAEAGFATWQRDQIIRLNNGTGTITWGSTFFDPAALVLGHATSRFGERIDFQNGLDLNGADRTVRVHKAFDPDYRSVSKISGAIVNSTGTAGLVKEGVGVLELTGANTYTGPTTVRGGVLRANHGQGLPAGSNLALDGGVLESLGAVAFDRPLGTGAGQVQFGPAGGGFAASGGPMTVRLGGTTDPVTWGAGGFVPAGAALRLGSTSSDALTDFRNGIDLNAATRSVVVVPGETAAARSRLSGVLSNGGLAVTGGGTLELTGANTYAGPTTLTGGTLRANDGQGLPANSPLTLNGGVLESIGPATFARVIGPAAGQVQFGADGGGFSAAGGELTVRLNGTTDPVTWGSAGFVPAAAALRFGSQTADAVADLRNGLDLAAGNRTVLVADNPAVATDRGRVSGVVSNGGLVKTGPGTLELSGANTYAGTTEVQEGAVRANHGQGLPAGSNLYLNGGVIEGSGNVTFSRPLGTGAGQVRFGADGGGFSAGGGTMIVQLNGTTAPVRFNDPHFVSGDTGQLRFGSATADGLVDFQNGLNLNGFYQEVAVAATPGKTGPSARLSGVVTNGELAKVGPGTLELTAANTHADGTNVYGGKLLVNNATGSGTGTGSVYVDFEAALGGSGRIAPASGFEVEFSFNSRLEPGGGADNSLRIETVGGGTIRLEGTWATRVLSPGTGGVAANSGGSTAGADPANPDNHTFLDLSAGGTANAIQFVTAFYTWEVDGTGVAFTPFERYSYRIGRVGAAGELSGGPLNVTDQTKFRAVGFEAREFSLTSDGAGVIYLNFTPVPEPGLLLAVVAAGLGLAVVPKRGSGWVPLTPSSTSGRTR